MLELAPISRLSSTKSTADISPFPKTVFDSVSDAGL